MNSCLNCGFKPHTVDDKAKSLILSVAYEIDGIYLGQTKDELNAVASRIRSGVPYEFDEREVRQVASYARKVMTIPTSRLVIDGLKWVGPPVLILFLIYFLLHHSK
jgi:hypothetical protein